MSRLIRLEKTEGIYGPTLQGEGLNIGSLCAFVRLYGCDFRCKWCDTPFSLGKDMGGEYEEVTAEEIIKRLKALGLIKWVVLSGGNPLVQGQNLDPLVQRLWDHNYLIQVETQGSIYPTPAMWSNVQFWSLSPKLPSAGEMESKNWKYVVSILEQALVKKDLGLNVNAQLKFVVADEKDYIFLKDKLTRFPITTQVPIILQPEGQQNVEGFSYTIYAESIKELFRWVKRDDSYWSRYELRILPQLHKIIWGKERGR